MGLWKNFKSLFKSQQQATKTVSVSATQPMDLIGSNSISMTRGGALNTNELVFSTISRLSNLLAGLPIHLYKKYEENDTGVAGLVRTAPNDNQTGFELMRQTETARNTYGNGFIWIERDERLQPVKLWPIDPGYVIVMRNVDDNSIWYRIDDDEGRHFLVPNVDMIHVKHISLPNQELGISPIDVLKGSLQFQKQIEEFSLSEMGKKEAYIIKYDRSVSKESRQAILNDFRKMVRSNGGAILVEQGYDVDRYESKFKPSDLQTVEAITRNRIATAFNVPVSFLNDNQAKATTNPEHVMTDFAINTLVPIVRQYEAEFNKKLLTQAQRSRGYYFKFNVNGLLRGDTAARTEMYQMMIRNGVATQNELRKLEDLPPIKEKSADVLWISKDLFPSENQLKASNTEATQMTTQSDLEGGDQSDGEDSKDASQAEDSKLSDSQARGKHQRSNHVY